MERLKEKFELQTIWIALTVERLAGRHLADNVDLPQARRRELPHAEEGVLGVVAVRGRGGLKRQRCRCEQNRHFSNFMRSRRRIRRGRAQNRSVVI